MSDLFHLRLDVHKIQEFIFSTPILKYMLGANSCIGELFSQDFIALMPPVKNSFFPKMKVAEEIDSLFQKNILSSAGGHFEAIFEDMNALEQFVKDAQECINLKTPGLEYSFTYRKFDPKMNFKDFLNLPPVPLCLAGNKNEFVDAPFYDICQYDGESVGIAKERDNETKKVYGKPKQIMAEQAKRFSKLDSSDAVSQFYKELNIDPKHITTDLEKLTNLGKSLKNNMVAYLKADGNGMGARFRNKSKELQDQPVMEAFMQVESFWNDNRKRISYLLQRALEPYILNTLPFILFMMGGDDLFLVCTPEIALKIAEDITQQNDNSPSLSVGIAFTKFTYPIAQAHKIAEMCLDSAKAAGYAFADNGRIEPFIDWHVNFDSAYQELKDIRRSSYMLNYCDGDTEIVEILSKRPYTNPDLTELREEVTQIAQDLDRDEAQVSNNKIKSYRSTLKNGYRDVEYMRKMLGINEDMELSRFFVYSKPINNIRIDNSLDKIELIDIYRTTKREVAQHAEN
ncbi:MAG: hypothetical protein PWP64_1005 [Candidatus Cloacimonadota bacterium]|nr:hypothetical protein [Candidatus Cloacimonadota bacterium]